MLNLQNISYIHPNKDLLFEQISLNINQQQKTALIGNNGVGKSTLLKIISGKLQASAGQLSTDAEPYYIPQIFGQFNHLSIAQALRINHKLEALNAILNGSSSENDFEILNDDWSIEERCTEALKYWQLTGLDLNIKLEMLSGGQKTKVFLAGISIHRPKLVLLDEPSNHLDVLGRNLLYDFIKSTGSTLLIVSHDRKLLNLLDSIAELSQRGLKIYGGNYSFYTEQKKIENDALNQDLKNKEKALRKAKEKERDTLERQQKLDARGKNKQEKAGVSRIMLNTLRNSAENSTAKLKDIHLEKNKAISKELQTLRKEIPDIEQMKFDFNNSAIHKGKILIKTQNINISYNNKPLWAAPLNLQLTSAERVALKGLNGSGKTTLIKIILNQAKPTNGTIKSSINKSIYIDQDYSIIKDTLKVYEQAQQFNSSDLQEHEIKIRLNRFLFTKEDWDKPCHTLSGGEKMRLILCCLTINSEAPDLIILDEPTNNLDIQNIEILTKALNQYKGSLLVVSHDDYFLEQINIERIINL